MTKEKFDGLKYGFFGKETTIEEICEEVGPGWSHLVTDLVDNLLTVGWNGTVFQVKEKFGGLRFYIGTGTEAMFDLIRAAEERSFQVCEDCGAMATLREHLPWMRTLCTTCLEKIGSNSSDTREVVSQEPNPTPQVADT